MIHNYTERSVSDLSLHPALKNQPALPKDSSEFLGLVEDIRDRGIDDPLKIDESNRVVDGRHRFWAAQIVGLESVPVRVITCDEVVGAIVGSLAHRRHLTQGQRAYLIFPFFEEALREGVSRRIANLKRGTQPGVSSGVLNESSRAKLAQRLGISESLIQQARTLHHNFSEHPDLRDEFEPKILDLEKPIGLGAAIAGIAGKLSTEDKPRARRENEQLELFCESFETLGKRLKYWGNLDENTRTQALPVIRQTVASMPPDLRAKLKQAIAAADKADQN